MSLDQFIAAAVGIRFDPATTHGLDQSAAWLYDGFATDGVDLRDPAQARAALSAALHAQALASNDGGETGVGDRLHGLSITLARIAKEAGR